MWNLSESDKPLQHLPKYLTRAHIIVVLDHGRVKKKDHKDGTTVILGK